MAYLLICWFNNDKSNCMKNKNLPRKSLKEEQFMDFCHRTLLAKSAAAITDELDTIIAWVEKHGGIPVKATYVDKNHRVIELIELHFGEKNNHFFKPISWKEWYDVFVKEKFKFIYLQTGDDAKGNWYYKLSR